MAVDNVNAESRWRRFLRSQTLSGVLGIAGLIFGLFTWYDGKIDPDLYVLFDPDGATTIVSPAAPGLEVRFNGSPIQGEIAAQTIKLWNRGKRPIKREDILEELIVTAKPEVRILDAKVTQQVRAISTIAVTLPAKNSVERSTNGQFSNQLKLDWRILEIGDGGTVQVIYAGQARAQFQVGGTIVGQRVIGQGNRRSPDNNHKKPPAPDESFLKRNLLGILTSAFASVLLGVTFLPPYGTTMKLLGCPVDGGTIRGAIMGLLFLIVVGSGLTGMYYQLFVLGPLDAPF